MHDDFHPGDSFFGNRAYRGRNAGYTLVPILPPVAGYEEPRRTAGRRRGRDLQSENGIDPGIAGNVDCPADSLPAKIRRAKLGRRKQQPGI